MSAPIPARPRGKAAESAPTEGPLVDALAGFQLDPARSYTAQVHDVLLRAIVRGTLPPRTALSEATISKLIDVSRTPVREALAQLADEQMVLIYRQVGTIVAPVRTQLLEEGRFVRSTLECASHVQLVQTITPSQLEEFGQIVQRQRSAVETGEIDRFSELDELMHRRLFEFAGRGHVWEMLEPIKRQFDRVRWLLLGHVAGHADRALQEHEQMLAQMASRDVAGLGASVSSHINHITTHLAALREQAPESYFSN
ncbi:GntR family transcriptional regulator [Variovorax sp. J22R133]|uniref:GntR family transcriptional regulator n=1 Tax=Variovorax brevis TaxID=3053503 RepID=UPI002576B730|nr:GntR family transcriptional regulator [Variovorax sp. J22R133]MDM0112824.1 GntR family transcriptional regulator [Variovorax sp. J22R133]